jgi:hypothetical protein
MTGERQSDPIPPISPEANPLVEASPASFEELFSRDPLDLEERDIKLIVEKLRADRLAWRQAELEGKRTAPKSGAKAPKPKADPAAVAALAKELGLD